jgi:hypothetical protein
MWSSGLGLAVAVGLVSTVLYAPSASAASCPSESVGGKPVGWIEVDGIKVPIKPVSYPAGGELAPPRSNKVVGLSTRHRALLATRGTTVLTWHVRYGEGCYGTLNPLLEKPVGTTFTVTDKTGSSKQYRLTGQRTVQKGRYEPEWFRDQGAPQLSMFTCSDLRQGKYRKTTAVFAVPVDQQPSVA